MSYHMDSMPKVEYVQAPSSGARLRGSYHAKRVKRTITYRDRNNNLAIVKKCMRRLAEKKHVSTSVGVAPTLIAGTVGSLSILSQGTGATNRIGMQIANSYLDVKGVFYAPAGMAGETVRLIFFIDKEPGGANPAVADIIESAATIAPYNKDKLGVRFSIIKDYFMPVVPMAATVVTPQVTFRFRVPLNVNTYYQSNAGTISDLLRNNIGYCVLSSGGNSSLNFVAQLCFTDV